MVELPPVALGITRVGRKIRPLPESHKYQRGARPSRVSDGLTYCQGMVTASAFQPGAYSWEVLRADKHSIGPQRPDLEEEQEQGTGATVHAERPQAAQDPPAARRTAETRCLHGRPHDDSEETELG